MEIGSLSGWAAFKTILGGVMRVNSHKQDQLVQAIRKARGETIYLLELVVGKSPQWTTLRSRVLRIFGDRGLEATAISLLEDRTTNGNGDYEHNE